MLAKRSDDYGKLPNKGQYDIEEEHKISIEEVKGNIYYDELTMLQKLVSNGLSTCIDLRGGLEQTTLRWAQVDLDFLVESGEYKGGKGVNISDLFD